MSAKIRYIFGAGASFGAVPLVKDMPDAVYEYAKAIEVLVHGLNPKAGTTADFDRIRNLKEFSAHLEKTASELKGAFSFDTLAKSLWVRDMLEYQKLKFTIETIILLEEYRNRHNARYDAFLAALAIKERRLMPLENIQIINWNYDNQFLKALKLIDPNIAFSDWPKNLNHIYVNGSAKSYASPIKPNETFLEEIQEHGEVKLREYSEKTKLNAKIKVPAVLVFIDHINAFSSFREVYDFDPGIQYSWELSKPKVERGTTFKTNHTVIIGYSLPTFNRLIDKTILHDQAGGGNIYYQCGEGNSSVRSKLLGMGFNPDKLIAIDDVNEFFIPPEYDLN